MTLWQFDTFLVPQDVARDAGTSVQDAITEDGVDTAPLWQQRLPTARARQILAARWPENRDSLQDLRFGILRFGREERVLLELFDDAGLVEGCSARVDGRHCETRDVEALLTRCNGGRGNPV